MERKVLTTALLLALELARGQNLVPNGSFEEYIDCPTSFGYWSDVVGWISPYTQSADYFNSCAENIACSVPFNDFGYQEAADGQAYMGIFTWVTSFGGYYREVIAAQLLEPLQPGVPIFISFKASPGGFGNNHNNSATWAAKGPGMNFFTHIPSDWQNYLFPNDAAVDMPTVLSDTSNWVTISGIYVPDSAYTWLAIANFYENDLSFLEPLDDSGTSDGAYSFIDDVCISYNPNYCWGGSTGLDDNDALPILTGVFDGYRLLIHGVGNIGEARLFLTDVSGRVIWNGRYPSGVTELSIELPELSPAFYFLTIQTERGLSQTTRLLHSVQP